MFDFRTDLADERAKIVYKKENNYDGISVKEKIISDNVKTTIVKVLNETGSKKINKSIGTYTTININELEIIDEKQIIEIIEALNNEIIKFLTGKKSILILGLGNRNTTADCLGPDVIDNIEITRHILKYKPELLPEKSVEVSAIAPGVLGTTGIETCEILKSIVKIIKPEIVIAIDSLSTNDINRLLKTIQITDTGIIPGAGVGNRRKEISEKTIGVPVVAIGVPTVVQAATIVANTFDILTERFNEFNFLKNSSYEEKYKLVSLVLEKSKYNLSVMPKEIDILVDNLRSIISKGINQSIKQLSNKRRKH